MEAGYHKVHGSDLEGSESRGLIKLNINIEILSIMVRKVKNVQIHSIICYVDVLLSRSSKLMSSRVTVVASKCTFHLCLSIIT